MHIVKLPTVGQSIRFDNAGPEWVRGVIERVEHDQLREGSLDLTVRELGTNARWKVGTAFVPHEILDTPHLH
jgi:hypothetical protein